MSLWRREAIKRFPDLHRKIADAEGPYLVWQALRHLLFRPAFKTDPPDTETLTRVYAYAAWSLKQRSRGVRLAAVDEFYEWLPDDPRTRREMPQWISSEEFETLFKLLDFIWDDSVRQDFYRNKRSRSVVEALHY